MRERAAANALAPPAAAANRARRAHAKKKTINAHRREGLRRERAVEHGLRVHKAVVPPQLVPERQLFGFFCFRLLRAEWGRGAGVSGSAAALAHCTSTAPARCRSNSSGVCIGGSRGATNTHSVRHTHKQKDAPVCRAQGPSSPARLRLRAAAGSCPAARCARARTRPGAAPCCLGCVCV